MIPSTLLKSPSYQQGGINSTKPSTQNLTAKPYQQTPIMNSHHTTPGHLSTPVGSPYINPKTKNIPHSPHSHLSHHDYLHPQRDSHQQGERKTLLRLDCDLQSLLEQSVGIPSDEINRLLNEQYNQQNQIEDLGDYDLKKAQGQKSLSTSASPQQQPLKSVKKEITLHSYQQFAQSLITSSYTKIRNQVFPYVRSLSDDTVQFFKSTTLQPIPGQRARLSTTQFHYQHLTFNALYPQLMMLCFPQPGWKKTSWNQIYNSAWFEFHPPTNTSNETIRYIRSPQQGGAVVNNNQSQSNLQPLYGGDSRFLFGANNNNNTTTTTNNTTNPHKRDQNSFDQQRQQQQQKQYFQQQSFSQSLALPTFDDSPSYENFDMGCFFAASFSSNRDFDPSLNPSQQFHSDWTENFATPNPHPQGATPSPPNQFNSFFIPLSILSEWQQKVMNQLIVASGGNNTQTHTSFSEYNINSNLAISIPNRLPHSPSTNHHYLHPTKMNNTIMQSSLNNNTSNSSFGIPMTSVFYWDKSISMTNHNLIHVLQIPIHPPTDSNGVQINPSTRSIHGPAHVIVSPTIGGRKHFSDNNNNSNNNNNNVDKSGTFLLNVNNRADVPIITPESALNVFFYQLEVGEQEELNQHMKRGVKKLEKVYLEQVDGLLKEAKSNPDAVAVANEFNTATTAPTTISDAFYDDSIIATHNALGYNNYHGPSNTKFQALKDNFEKDCIEYKQNTIHSYLLDKIDAIFPNYSTQLAAPPQYVVTETGQHFPTEAQIRQQLDSGRGYNPREVLQPKTVGITVTRQQLFFFYIFNFGHMLSRQDLSLLNKEQNATFVEQLEQYSKLFEALVKYFLLETTFFNPQAVNLVATMIYVWLEFISTNADNSTVASPYISIWLKSVFALFLNSHRFQMFFTNPHTATNKSYPDKQPIENQPTNYFNSSTPSSHSNSPQSSPTQSPMRSSNNSSNNSREWSPASPQSPQQQHQSNQSIFNQTFSSSTFLNNNNTYNNINVNNTNDYDFFTDAHIIPSTSVSYNQTRPNHITISSPQLRSTTTHSLSNQTSSNTTFGPIVQPLVQSLTARSSNIPPFLVSPLLPLLAYHMMSIDHNNNTNNNNNGGNSNTYPISIARYLQPTPFITLSTSLTNFPTIPLTQTAPINLLLYLPRYFTSQLALNQQYRAWQLNQLGINHHLYSGLSAQQKNMLLTQVERFNQQVTLLQKQHKLTTQLMTSLLSRQSQPMSLLFSMMIYSPQQQTGKQSHMNGFDKPSNPFANITNQLLQSNQSRQNLSMELVKAGTSFGNCVPMAFMSLMKPFYHFLSSQLRAVATTSHLPAPPHPSILSNTQSHLDVLLLGWISVIQPWFYQNEYLTRIRRHNLKNPRNQLALPDNYLTTQATAQHYVPYVVSLLPMYTQITLQLISQTTMVCLFNKKNRLKPYVDPTFFTLALLHNQRTALAKQQPDQFDYQQTGLDWDKTQTHSESWHLEQIDQFVSFHNTDLHCYLSYLSSVFNLFRNQLDLTIIIRHWERRWALSNPIDLAGDGKPLQQSDDYDLTAMMVAHNGPQQPQAQAHHFKKTLLHTLFSDMYSHQQHHSHMIKTVEQEQQHHPQKHGHDNKVNPVSHKHSYFGYYCLKQPSTESEFVETNYNSIDANGNVIPTSDYGCNNGFNWTYDAHCPLYDDSEVQQMIEEQQQTTQKQLQEQSTHQPFDNSVFLNNTISCTSNGGVIGQNNSSTVQSLSLYKTPNDRFNVYDYYTNNRISTVKFNILNWIRHSIVVARDNQDQDVIPIDALVQSGLGLVNNPRFEAPIEANNNTGVTGVNHVELQLLGMYNNIMATLRQGGNILTSKLSSNNNNNFDIIADRDSNDKNSQLNTTKNVVNVTPFNNSLVHLAKNALLQQNDVNKNVSFRQTSTKSYSHHNNNNNNNQTFTNNNNTMNNSLLRPTKLLTTPSKNNLQSYLNNTSTNMKNLNTTSSKASLNNTINRHHHHHHHQQPQQQPQTQTTSEQPDLFSYLNFNETDPYASLTTPEPNHIKLAEQYFIQTHLYQFLSPNSNGIPSDSTSLNFPTPDRVNASYQPLLNPLPLDYEQYQYWRKYYQSKGHYEVLGQEEESTNITTNNIMVMFLDNMFQSTNQALALRNQLVIFQCYLLTLNWYQNYLLSIKFGTEKTDKKFVSPFALPDLSIMEPDSDQYKHIVRYNRRIYADIVERFKLPSPVILGMTTDPQDGTKRYNFQANFNQNLSMLKQCRDVIGDLEHFFPLPPLNITELLMGYKVDHYTPGMMIYADNGTAARRLAATAEPIVNDGNSDDKNGVMKSPQVNKLGGIIPAAPQFITHKQIVSTHPTQRKVFKKIISQPKFKAFVISIIALFVAYFACFKK